MSFIFDFFWLTMIKRSSVYCIAKLNAELGFCVNTFPLRISCHPLTYCRWLYLKRRRAKRKIRLYETFSEIFRLFFSRVIRSVCVEENRLSTLSRAHNSISFHGSCWSVLIRRRFSFNAVNAGAALILYIIKMNTVLNNTSPNAWETFSHDSECIICSYIIINYFVDCVPSDFWCAKHFSF